MNSAMTVRERFQAVMNFRPADRLPMVEWASWWDKTLDRWCAEGLPTRDRYGIYRHFGLDLWYQDWLRSRGPLTPAPAAHGAPLIESMDDYERIRPTLFPEPTPQQEEEWRRIAVLQARGECVFWITLEGFFWFPRTLLGIEPHLYAFYDQPELMHRLNRDLAEHHLRLLDRICRIVTPDFMTFAEDLSYNHGPMLSAELFREFLLPGYNRVVPRLRERGILSIIDSDGQVEEPAAWFLEAGLDGILPLERQSGVDVARLRQNFPRLRLIGAFDKMTMTKGETAMRAEFERLLPVMRQGGFIPSVDHQTPPGVSLPQYHTYLRLLTEYATAARVSNPFSFS